MAVNYTDVQKTEKYISRTNFDALEMAAVPEGTEFNIVDQIHESDLDSDVLQKLNNNAKINTENTFTAAQTFKKDITIEGNIIQNGSAYETHAEKLYTKNDMIYTRDGATAALADNAYSGIQAVKYDGTNDGQLVFGKDGVARVGDVGNTQPLATRAEAGALTDGHVLQWDAAGQTLVDSGKSVEDFATINDIPDTSKFAKLTDLARDPAKTYLVWKGSDAAFRALANSTVDWGDGTVEIFTTDSTSVTHTYSDGADCHLITISGLTSIVDYAFYGCSGLTSIIIPNSVTSIGRSAFANCSGLTNIIIPNSVTSMGRGAFVSCSKLTSVTISNGVTSIIANAFSMCSGLTSVTIPDSVTSIGDWAFSGCSGLISATIGNGVTSIDSEAFSGCNGLKTIRISAINPPTLGSNAFDTSIEKIIVPKSAINTYKSAAGWSTYANKIVYEVDSSDLSGVTSVTTSGTGNAVTTASISGNTLTLTKGSTFLTSHQSLDSCAKLSGSNTFTSSNTFNQHINLKYGPEGYVDFGNGLKFWGNYVTKTANSTQTYSLWFPSNKTGSHTFAMLDDLPEANPTAAGTVTLTKLKVGDVVYNIPSGGSGGVTSVTTSGTGNAVTGASISGNTLTLTKGSTFLTSHQSLDSCAKLSGNNTFTGNNTFKTQDTNPVVTIKQDESNLTVLSGRKLEIFDSIGGEANKKRYNAKYMGNCIIHDVIDYSGEQSKVNSMKLWFPEKEGANAFTLATTDDIPISSATLSDNDTTLTLVLK